MTMVMDQGILTTKKAAVGGGGGFDPLSLSPVLWLMSDKGLFKEGGAPAEADGDPIATWQDQSGNNRHHIQPTQNQQPTLKLGLLNGKNVVRFDGVDDSLFIDIPVTTNVSVTVFAVPHLQDLVRKGPFIHVGTFDSNGYMLGVGGADMELNGNNLSVLFPGVRWINPGINYGGAGGKLACLKLSATGKPTLYINGASIFSDTGTGPNMPVSNTGVGSQNGVTYRRYNASLAEILVYNSALSDPQRQQVETHLNTKWGLF